MWAIVPQCPRENGDIGGKIAPLQLPYDIMPEADPPLMGIAPLPNPRENGEQESSPLLSFLWKQESSINNLDTPMSRGMTAFSHL